MRKFQITIKQTAFDNLTIRAKDEEEAKRIGKDLAKYLSWPNEKSKFEALACFELNEQGLIKIVKELP